MNNIAIKVENLSKLYKIGVARQDTLRDAIGDFRFRIADWRSHTAHFLHRSPNLQSTISNHQSEDTIWALKDVSFEVHRGEVVGIIGRNGAGKSTLLKILSRITEPTSGRAIINGRVGSLLEVGTGFHPELTGRENITLNGAILGMKRAEIERKFDEIVAFAEIERFLDTPVKRYSSGMYVRLAFAVAAHLEPEILLVDEVLAVGDAAFQKKCLGKMGEVAREGRTVLFVSHNMQAIRQLCQRAMVLESGVVNATGHAVDVVEQYLRGFSPAESGSSLDTLIRQLPFDPAFRLEGIALTQNGRPVVNSALSGQPLEIEIRYQVLERTTGLRVFFDLYDSDDTLLFRSFHDEQAEGIPQVAAGRYISKAVIPTDLLAPRLYELRFYATIFNVRYCTPESGIRFPLYVERAGKANQAYLSEPIRGKLAPVIPWTTSCL